MPTVSRTFVVTVTPPVVIDYLKDFSNAEAWDPGTVSCTRQDDGPVQVGSTFHNVSKIAGVETELTYKLTKLTGGSLVFEGENESATSVDTITVVSHADGSEITYEAVIEAKGIGKLAEPLMKLVFERIGTKTEEQMTEVINAL
ncbi:SRPBCC family protein [soil metagenome]